MTLDLQYVLQYACQYRHKSVKLTNITLNIDNLSLCVSQHCCPSVPPFVSTCALCSVQSLLRFLLVLGAAILSGGGQVWFGHRLVQHFLFLQLRQQGQQTFCFSLKFFTTIINIYKYYKYYLKYIYGKALHTRT